MLYGIIDLECLARMAERDRVTVVLVSEIPQLPGFRDGGTELNIGTTHIPACEKKIQQLPTVSDGSFYTAQDAIVRITGAVLSPPRKLARILAKVLEHMEGRRGSVICVENILVPNNPTRTLRRAEAIEQAFAGQRRAALITIHSTGIRRKVAGSESLALRMIEIARRLHEMIVGRNGSLLPRHDPLRLVESDGAGGDNQSEPLITPAVSCL